jgi:hypothetical protein
MEKQSTILLGGWTAFSEARGLFKKEEPETFGWMSVQDAFWYEDLRAALDATPGSREFLRSLSSTDHYRSPMIDSVLDKMSPLHSGTSCSYLISSYRAALEDWDFWVSATKREKLMRQYKDKQIDFTHLIIFHNHLVHFKPAVTDEETFKQAMEKARVIFSDGEKPVEVGWGDGVALDIVTALLDEMRERKAEEDARWKALHLKERVDYLEFNLKHPSRWFWSQDQHPRYSITAEEMVEMEKRNPGYGRHIALVCQHLNTLGHGAGWERTEDSIKALDARLRELGIIKASS